VFVAIPDGAAPVLSEHVKLTVTFVLFQPDPFAAGVRDPVITGFVLSILTLMVVALLTFPALSVHVPLTLVPVVSAERSELDVQDAMPLGPLSPLLVKLTVTSLLFHPAPLANGLLAPVGPLGADASRLIVTELELVPPALVAEHVSVMPAVSVLMVVGPQPVDDVTVDSGSVTVQETLTLLVYHPFVPRVPETLGVITGGVVSPPTRKLKEPLAMLLPALS
jgi:hypothetical protein